MKNKAPTTSKEVLAFPHLQVSPWLGFSPILLPVKTHFSPSLVETPRSRAARVELGRQIGPALGLRGGFRRRFRRFRPWCFFRRRALVRSAENSSTLRFQCALTERKKKRKTRSGEHHSMREEGGGLWDFVLWRRTQAMQWAALSFLCNLAAFLFCSAARGHRPLVRFALFLLLL